MLVCLPIIFKNEHIVCEGCALGKQHRKKFPIHTVKREKKIPLASGYRYLWYHAN